MLKAPITPESLHDERFSKLKRISKIFQSPEKKKKSISIITNTVPNWQETTPESIRYGGSDLFHQEEQSTPPLRKSRSSQGKRSNFTTYSCVFCEESLMSILQDEDPPINLTCSHKCHAMCYLMSLDRSDLTYAPRCQICGKGTRCEDKEIEEKLLKELLLVSEDIDMDSENDIFMDDAIISAKEDQIDQDSLVSSISAATTTKSSSYTYSFEDDTLHYITTPKIILSPESHKLKITQNDGQRINLNCFIQIDAPINQTPPEEHALDCELIQNEIFQRLYSNVEQWNGVNLRELGELICFDYLHVNTINDFHHLHKQPVSLCILFTKTVLIMNETCTESSGSLMIHDLISVLETTTVAHDEDTVVELNLRTESLPMVYLYLGNKIILKKWFNLLTKLAMNRFEFDRARWIQLSTNAWNLIDQNRDSIPFTKPSFKTYQMSIAKPLRAPASFILCVSLHNNDRHISNAEYLANLQKLIRTTLKSLHKSDTFGLITIGKDPINGEFSPKGTFTGMISPKWIEWEEIIETLEVTSDAVFQDQYEEILEYLKQVQNLMDTNSEFVSTVESHNRIRKASLVFNSSSSRHSSQQEKDSINESRICSLLQSIILRHDIEIDSILISAGQDSYRHKYLYYLSNSLKIVSMGSVGDVQVNLNSKSHRFNTYNAFITSIPRWIEELDDIAIPSLEVQVTTEINNNNVKFSGFENALTGEIVKFPTEVMQNCDDFKLKLSNVRYNETRTFLLQLSLEPSAKIPNEEVAVCVSKATWLNTLKETDPQLTSVKIISTSSSSAPLLASPALERPKYMNPILQSFNLSLSDDEEEEKQELDEEEGIIPVYSPMLSSSTRETSYIKREIELIFIGAMMTSIESGKASTLSEAISVIFGMLKSGCGSTDGYNSKQMVQDYDHKITNIRNYVEDLCQIGERIVAQDLTDPQVVRKGYDFCFRLI